LTPGIEVPRFVRIRTGAGGVSRRYHPRVAVIDGATRALPEPEVECWLDYSSPFAYLGSTQIERVASAALARVSWHPFLLGALFQQIGAPTVPIATFPEAKQRHTRLDLARWADHWQVPFRFSSRFPLRTVDALRTTLLVDPDHRAPLVHAIMRATWALDLDPADPAVLRDCAIEAGLPESLPERAANAKQALFAATTEAVARGVPGAPTFIVGDQLFWGQDRLEFVGKALRGWRVSERGSTMDPPTGNDST
jgi:2-hydroxychromene-2-carboxylate isomerase